MLHRG